MTEEDMYRTFNMGIGYCLVARREGVDEILDITAEHSPSVIGLITSDPRVVLS